MRAINRLESNRMRRVLVRGGGGAFLAMASLLAAHAAEPPIPEPALDLAFSRRAASASVEIGGAQAIVLRADRDIVAMKIELRPIDAPGGGPPETWDARLFALPSTEVVAAVDAGRLRGRTPNWRLTQEVTRGRPFAARVKAEVSRPAYKNWLLVLDPKTARPNAVELRVEATPLGEAARVWWLMSMRAQFTPQSQPDLVRNLTRFMTDDEVRYWTGLVNREAFQRIWLRMDRAQMFRDFPGTEFRELTTRGHTLPNGLSLSSDGYRPEPPR